MIYYSLITANIVMSYVVWVLVSLVFYDKLKNTLIYVIFPTALYAIPAVYFTVVRTSLLATCALTLSTAQLLLFAVTRRSPIKLVLIPLPLILCTAYEVVVSTL